MLQCVTVRCSALQCVAVSSSSFHSPCPTYTYVYVCVRVRKTHIWKVCVYVSLWGRGDSYQFPADSTAKQVTEAQGIVRYSVFLPDQPYTSNLLHDYMHFAVYCSMLNGVAVCCSVLQCMVACCRKLECISARGRVLECVAACCRVLECVAACCSVLECVAACCRVLECVAACCRVLQCIAVNMVCTFYNVWMCTLDTTPLHVCEIKCILHVCDLTNSQVCAATFSHSWHDSRTLCCSTLQCVAVCCSTLRRVVMCCSDSFTLGTWLAHMRDPTHVNMRDMTHSHAWHYACRYGGYYSCTNGGHDSLPPFDHFHEFFASEELPITHMNESCHTYEWVISHI